MGVVCECNKCKKKFIDYYDLTNELNKRIWCNDCIKVIWRSK